MAFELALNDACVFLQKDLEFQRWFLTQTQVKKTVDITVTPDNALEVLMEANFSSMIVAVANNYK